VTSTRGMRDPTDDHCKHRKFFLMVQSHLR